MRDDSNVTRRGESFLKIGAIQIGLKHLEGNPIGKEEIYNLLQRVEKRCSALARAFFPSIYFNNVPGPVLGEGVPAHLSLPSGSSYRVTPGKGREGQEGEGVRSERGIGGRTERGRVGRRKGRGRGSEVAGTEKETERERATTR